MDELDQLLYSISVWAPVILLAVPLHEAAHGFAALKFGDDTAKRFGRLSLNPLRHVDLFGTLIMPAMLLFASGGRFVFGWAKPVPVDFSRLRPFRMGMVLTALAGPGTNVILAFVSALLVHAVGLVPPGMREWALDVLFSSIQLNLVLAVFNMLPLPPLDGGRVAVGVLPIALARPLARLEHLGIPILLVLLFLLPMAGINVLPWLIEPPVRLLGSVIIQLAGL